MRLKNREIKKKARIEIIPLIDIMFFLLATFVVVSTAMIKNRGIPVRLPTAESSSQESRKDYVSISISEDGVYFLNKESIPGELLQQRLLDLKGATPDPKVFIKGDAKAQLEKVVFALDALRKAGISKIALETAVPKASEGK